MGMKKKEQLVNLEIPKVPALPITTVNPQPRNEESPVKPALKRLNENGKLGSETMTKADWGAKDRSIAMLALIADVYKSPVVAQQAVGLNQADVFALIDKHFTHALALYEGNK